LKRLVRKGDAARLHDINIDPQLAIQAIAAKEKGFTQDKIIKDSGASKFAYWGAISDDGRYLVEAYMFDGMQGQRRVAFVAAPIENGQLQNNLEVSCYNIEGASEIRSMAKSGLNIGSGRLTFENEYAGLDQLPKAEEQNTQENPAEQSAQQVGGQPPKAAKKK
jgi:hypothetical protein